ncbi:hypothetical protein C8J57DRAFT_1480998 [Mycena rebaudengoi]|nr:hypothetical protein C8J57DRAFT_1480998 [Mycena rebaudengoi]
MPVHTQSSARWRKESKLRWSKSLASVARSYSVFRSTLEIGNEAYNMVRASEGRTKRAVSPLHLLEKNTKETIKGNILQAWWLENIGRLGGDKHLLRRFEACKASRSSEKEDARPWPVPEPAARVGAIRGSRGEVLIPWNERWWWGKRRKSVDVWEEERKDGAIFRYVLFDTFGTDPHQRSLNDLELFLPWSRNYLNNDHNGQQKLDERKYRAPDLSWRPFSLSTRDGYKPECRHEDRARQTWSMFHGIPNAYQSLLVLGYAYWKCPDNLTVPYNTTYPQYNQDDALAQNYRLQTVSNRLQWFLYRFRLVFRDSQTETERLEP